jgi:hypothetical protein
MKRASNILPKIVKEGAFPSDPVLSAAGPPLDEVELAFMARELIQLTLPHRDPGDIPLWTRTNGNVKLVMARTDIDENGRPVGYPYGSIPRLILHWLNSEVVRNKERRVELGHNLAQFMRALDLNPDMGTGKRSDARRLREQMNRLFSASIRFTRSLEAATGERGKRSKLAAVVEDSELWWDHKNPNQGYLWGSWIELSETFYRTLLNSPVPLNHAALKALKRSPLALDLYSWLCYRSWRATKLNAVQSVPWDLLEKQFGAEYAEPREFRRKARQMLKRIVTLQPELRIVQSAAGLEIQPSTLIIAPRPAPL